MAAILLPLDLWYRGKHCSAGRLWLGKVLGKRWIQSLHSGLALLSQKFVHKGLEIPVLAAWVTCSPLGQQGPHGWALLWGAVRAGAAPSLSLVILAMSMRSLSSLVSTCNGGCQDEARLALLHRNAHGWFCSITPTGWMAPAVGELD